MKNIFTYSFIFFIFISNSALAFTISSVITNVTCNGYNDGSVNITPVGGIAPYAFSWSNGETTEDIDSLVAGTYTVTVTDASSAVQTGSYIISQPTTLIINGSTHNVTCPGDSTGSIYFNVSGGTGAYTYSLNGSFPNALEANAENFQWVRQAGSTSTGSTDNRALAICTDKNNNVFITGEFYGNLTIGSTTLNSAGNSDLFVAKYSPAGTILWAQRIGGIGYDSGFGITADTSGNVFVTGRFRNTATFGSFTLTATSGDDLFIAKYDTNGNCIWVTHPSSTNFDIGWGITTDETGNIYVVGYFSGNITFTPLPTMNAATGANVMVVKLDQNGVPLWSKRAGGTGAANQGSAIALDHAGNVYITGYFTNNITFGTFTVSSLGSRDIFITKYNNAGTEQWVRSAGGTGDDYGLGICMDGTDNVYTTGYFRNSLNFGSGAITAVGGGDEIFVVKFDPAGTALWSQRAGASLNDRGMGITSDQFNNIYITGYYSGAATFGSYAAPVASINSAFIARYNSSGILQMLKESFSSGGSEGDAIFSNKKGSIYASGFFKGNANFGTIPMTSSGVDDLFACRFSMINAADTINDLPAGSYNIAISDFNGCTTNGTYLISEPPAINAVVTAIPPLCNGGNGTASLSISGGTPPYSQLWDTDPAALPAGNYFPVITDSLGCVKIIPVTITQPPLLIAMPVNSQETCFGMCNGFAYGAATGGTGNYSFLWNNTIVSDSINGLCPGNYNFIVTDENLCTDTTSITIQAATLIQPNSVITNTSCYGVCDGSVMISPSGGTPGYSYSWCNGSTTSFQNGLCSGSCALIISDANGCSIIDTVIINSPPPLFLDITSSSDTICHGACTSPVGAVNGGTPGYSYLWLPVEGLSDPAIFNPLACPDTTTNYTLSVTDGNGCMNSDSYLLNVDLCTGISENGDALIKIYPNPFSSVLHIDQGFSFPISLSIYDCLGRVIISKQLTVPADIDTEFFDTGLYLVKIEAPEFLKIFNLIKN